MTPRRIDADLIADALTKIDDDVHAFRSLDELTADRLLDDWLLRAAVERVLCRVVDRAVGINAHIAVGSLNRTPRDSAGSFEDAAAAGAITRELAAELVPSVGMRNAIARYQHVEDDRLAAAVTVALTGYDRYRSAVARYAIDNPSPARTDRR